jgi:Fur family ferric uptake transcriptional regulator
MPFPVDLKPGLVAKATALGIRPEDIEETFTRGSGSGGQKVNKTTIYRTLKVWERTGFVRRVAVSDRRQYFELTERGHHHHFICTNCKGVSDINLKNELDTEERSLERIYNVTIKSHSLEFFGICSTCQGR